MQTLLQAADWFSGWVWRATWQASAVIVLVLVAQWLLRNRLAPRWRHALWLLVVLRLALPGSVESRLSLFNWVPSRAQLAAALPVPGITGGASLDSENQAGTSAMPATPKAAREFWSFSPGSVLAVVWLAGALLLPAWLLADTVRLGRKVRGQRPVTDSAVLNLLEDCKQQMGVRTPLTVVETSAINSPALLGFIRPRLLLPEGLMRQFDLAELRYVFLHELSHIKRGDIAINWLATAALVLHWFNPLVWFALSRMRADRELACDALALSYSGESEAKPYGRTIIKLLERFSHPAVAPGLVGVLENNNQMKRRISMIATFKNTKSWPAVASVLFASLALVTLTDAQTAPVAKDSAADPKAPPRIVSTTPEVGDTEVDPALAEITITFDRDMGGGFSWTGGGPDYPPVPEGQKAQWRDKRTCVLPVKLEGARYYRVGINSKSYQNFRSAAGTSAKPTAIYFTTKGASEELKNKTLKPKVIAVNPSHAATDVDPGLKEITVTFSVPMGGGFSWVGGGPNFPTISEGQKPSWSEDKRTCTLPVELQPGWDYTLGLNSEDHNNFQSAGGVPLDPLVYSFKTRP